MRYEIYNGDCLEQLKKLQDNSIDTCITSPPYYGLRNYGVDGQIGLEETPERYVNKLVEVFREVKRVLKDDGTLWLNLGDTYNASSYHKDTKAVGDSKKQLSNVGSYDNVVVRQMDRNCKPKDLIGIPWMVAKALRQPYYTGVIKNITDRVWLASMMDAEGSFCLSQYNYKGKSKINLYISMTNSSEKIINKFDALFPQEIKHIYAKSGVVRKQVYRIDIEHLEKKEQFICEIFPHIVEKRKQCIVAYTFLQLQKGMPNKKYGYTDEQSEKRAELVELMHKLNAGEDVVLPNYCVEPHSLYEDGFYLRQDIIWAKANPLPESVKDRCTKSHEYIFLLSKSPTYYFDYKAIQEEANYDGRKDTTHKGSSKYADVEIMPNNSVQSMASGGHERWKFTDDGVAVRNKRDVWFVPNKPTSEAHFATFPIDLITPCVLAGSREGGTVLDPFSGSGTTGMVAISHKRNYIGVELNKDYIEIRKHRVENEVDNCWVEEWKTKDNITYCDAEYYEKVKILDE